MNCQRVACFVALLWCACLTSAAEKPQQPVLKKGDRLVLLGTSITYQKNYSRVVALYLASAWPDLEVDVGQYAISGKLTDFFCKHARAGCIDPLRPTLVTVWCYWYVNKGDELDNYDQAMRRLLAIFQDAGVRTALVGPPIVRGQDEFSRTWNTNVPRFTETARRIAADAGCPFIDVVHAMETAEARMARIKGGAYDIVAKDGMHPDSPGQMAIAVAFLRALGLNSREIAHLEFDAATGRLSVSEGHKVIATEPEGFTLESTRLPILLYKDHPSRSVAEVWDVAEQMGVFEDLNRFTLVVKNLKPGRYTVRWSAAGEKVFEAAALAKGINMVYEFPKCRGLQDHLGRLSNQVWLKLSVDDAIAAYYTLNRRELPKKAKEWKSQLLTEEDAGMDLEAVANENPLKLRELAAKALRARQTPLRHTITITPSG